ncbi:MAG: lysoplasmalogenase [Corynebacterium glutamicum]|uniref:lysoplasmalogenase n=1 Tax=Corynebacterium glutamicum TaxID=1718 RepID=UPI001466E5B0|nr:lysoplasmalogenase [Corynebacterium glutamicum]MDO5372061.1 lysoplasmalogenase [Corynebacterium glutamicum]GFK17674.1 hypothetical protein KbCgl_02460 [Corynebacterium glutamicum]
MWREFWDRTRQGTQALTLAVAKASSEPERAVYLVAASSNVLGSLSGQRRLKNLTKPLLMPLLMGRVLRSEQSDRALGALGLAGGWAGDLVLMKPQSLPQGAAGFALNHAAYCVLLWRRGARFGLQRTAIRAIPLGLAAALASWKAPKLVPMVLGYGGLLATTSTLADDSRLLDSSNAGSFGAGHGGNLFLISDAVLFVRELVLEDSSHLQHLADGVVMGTYTLAQLLLVDALFGDTK